MIDHGQDYTFSSHPIVPVSTIGAGDNFNAGLIYGLVEQNILLDNLGRLTHDEWSELIGYAIEFGTEACMSTENYVSKNFAERYKITR